MKKNPIAYGVVINKKKQQQQQQYNNENRARPHRRRIQIQTYILHLGQLERTLDGDQKWGYNVES